MIRLENRLLLVRLWSELLPRLLRGRLHSALLIELLLIGLRGLRGRVGLRSILRLGNIHLLGRRCGIDLITPYRGGGTVLLGLLGRLLGALLWGSLLIVLRLVRLWGRLILR
ncbi:MAG: hypothetical protein LBL23_08770 [Coriobacteriales bacterium]|nr:hypothetical protein [Coriobacteriales bacterium]